MIIETKFNPKDMVYFFDKDKKPQRKEIKSVEFYKDRNHSLLSYTMVGDRTTYPEKDLHSTQQELYSEL